MISLDDHDRAILHQLDQNARQTYSQMAEKLDLTKNAVSYRIKKMMKNGIIKKFYTLINPFKIGFESYRIYVSYQYSTPLIEERIINHFSSYPLNWWTISLEGRYDLAVITWVNDVNQFYKYWKETLTLYRDYFRKQHFSLYIQSLTNFK
jgi:DNA-binding Lrp family transcriptional regulator